LSQTENPLPLLWRLTRGGEVLAVLRPDGRSLVPELDSYFAVESAYEPTPAFAPLRRLFEREVELLEVDSEAENQEWSKIWEELLAPGMYVESADGQDRFNILWIHFKDGRAWWRPLYNSPHTVLRGQRPEQNAEADRPCD
jgi:hypothetical protein